MGPAKMANKNRKTWHADHRDYGDQKYFMKRGAQKDHEGKENGPTGYRDQEDFKRAYRFFMLRANG
ncbi:MAG TPA: hypothetical protein VN872_02880 [Candidatus Acidoferrum sp.]|nr:hypothetical protein [Candidatus Acidoferrum sp.]